MTKRDKRIEAMRRNPKSVRPDELHAVLVSAGFTCRHDGTSHKLYKRGTEKLSVPQRHPYLLPHYVLDALDLLEE